MTTERCKGRTFLARPMAFPEVFETPQDEANRFQIGQFGTGPVSLTKGVRYEFFKNCPFGIGDRS
jgi:hypothetical protein